MPEPLPTYPSRAWALVTKRLVHREAATIPPPPPRPPDPTPVQRPSNSYHQQRLDIDTL